MSHDEKKLRKKLELIERLLAKAESTTPAEAEALTAAAFKLMSQYGIDQATVDAARRAAGKTGEAVIHRVLTLNGVYARDERDGLAQVVLALDLRTASSGRRNLQVLYVYGHQSDVEVAMWLLQSLQTQASVALAAWWGSYGSLYLHHTPHERRAARGAFTRAFGLGAADKIRSIRAEAVKESEPGTDLVLVSRRARVDEHLESLGYATARPRQWSNGLAASSGRAADREANLGQGEIVHRRALI